MNLVVWVVLPDHVILLLVDDWMLNLPRLIMSNVISGNFYEYLHRCPNRFVSRPGLLKEFTWNYGDGVLDTKGSVLMIEDG